MLYIKPAKIPRIIGSNNTMAMQLSAGTKSSVAVGMNGMIWLHGGDTDLATEAIFKITREAHISGLTDRISKMLGASSAEAQPSPETHREA